MPLSLGLISCNRIKNNSEQAVQQVKENTKHVFKEQVQKAFHKVYPPFDHDKPDTDNNKKSFKDFLKVEISKDVQNIYCFENAIGIDASYMFAFNCNEGTSEKIIALNKLRIDSLTADIGSGLHGDFPWWDKELIKNLQKYSWSDGNQYFKYYWYDKKNKMAYFLDFDR